MTAPKQTPDILEPISIAQVNALFPGATLVPRDRSQRMQPMGRFYVGTNSDLYFCIPDWSHQPRLLSSYRWNGLEWCRAVLLGTCARD